MQVRDAATGAVLRTHAPWSDFAGGVRVAVGDVNGDGVQDVIAGAGPGAGAEVKVYSGADGALLHDFFAWPLGSFTGGVFVAAGDVNGDGRADVIVGADAGAGAEVKVFSGADATLLRAFYVWPLGSFTGGVRVAAADVDGDGTADIVCGAGPGAGAEVKVYRGTDGQLLHDLFLYSNFTGGVYVAAGDLTGEGKADIICGAGAGAGPQVFLLDGGTTEALASYFALPQDFTGGVRVGYSTKAGSGRAAVLAAAGPGRLAEVHAFDGLSTQSVLDFFAYDSVPFNGGLFMAG